MNKYNLGNYRIDWQQMALDIRKFMPLRKASVKMGRHRDWLAHIARGEIEEPKFSDGMRMVDFLHDLERTK